MRGTKAKQLRKRSLSKGSKIGYRAKITVKMVDSGQKDKDGKKAFLPVNRETIYCTGDRKIYQQLKKEYRGKPL